MPLRSLADWWRGVWRRARIEVVALIVVTALLSGAEIVVVIVEPLVPMHLRIAFAAVSFVVIVAAVVARLLAYGKLGSD